MSRSRFHIVAAAWTLGLLMLVSAAAQTPRQFAVTGYVFPRGQALASGQIDARALTRINYAFAVIREGRLNLGSPADAQNLAILTSLRKQNPSLSVVISVGGWLGSASFSDLAFTSETRKIFAASVIELLRRYDLDGLDVDWEYPGLPGAGNPCRREDKRNFTLLLKDLRERFDREQKTTGRRLLLTVAAGAFDDYLAHTEMNKVQRYVDTINLMTYDYAMPSVDSATGFNAPLFSDPAAPQHESVDASVRAFEQAGVPAGKILIGIPFYGRVWMRIANRNHGLFQPGKSASGNYAPFSAIRQDMLGHEFTRYWDEAASVPYLYSAEMQQFVSYDDADSITAKCGYTRTHKLGGVMFWEYFDDPSGELLQAIDRALGHLPENPRRVLRGDSTIMVPKEFVR